MAPVSQTLAITRRVALTGLTADAKCPECGAVPAPASK
jgi:hypothetical protein